MQNPQPPDHVLNTFGLTAHPPIAMGDTWVGGWRVGEVVLSLVPDHARAAWSASVRENLYVEGLRIARPFRATDGRYVVSGWRADTYIAGTPEPRHDEVVSVAARLHAATAALERPRFLAQPPVAPWVDVDVFVAADRAAWEAVPLRSRVGNDVNSSIMWLYDTVVPIALAIASSIRTPPSDLSRPGRTLARLDHAQVRDPGARRLDRAQHGQDQHRPAEHHQVHARVEADGAGQRHRRDRRAG